VFEIVIMTVSGCILFVDQLLFRDVKFFFQLLFFDLLSHY